MKYLFCELMYQLAIVLLSALFSVTQYLLKGKIL